MGLSTLLTLKSENVISARNQSDRQKRKRGTEEKEEEEEEEGEERRDVLLTYPVPPPAVLLGLGFPPKTLIRAPFWALDMVMFCTKTLATMSVSPAYWPRDPTEMP